MIQLTDQFIRLPVTFYERSTIEVARELIGKALLRRIENEWQGGWIVETEAYLDHRDPASHSARGRTPSNASMFADPGTLYVYPIHAKHCLNAVTETAGRGAAVLIRAVHPVWGIASMTDRRRSNGFTKGQTNARPRLTSGPAMLCQAIGVDREDDGKNLCTDPAIGIFSVDDAPPRRVCVGKRIGISKAKHRNLRFGDPDSIYLSRRIVP